MSVLENEYMFYQSSNILTLTGNVCNIFSYYLTTFFYINFIELHDRYECCVYENTLTHDYNFTAKSLVNTEKSIFGIIKKGQTNFSFMKFNGLSTQLECDSIRNVLEIKIIPHLFAYLE